MRTYRKHKKSWYLVALLASALTACNIEIQSRSDLADANGQDEEATQPSHITGSFLTYKNANVACSYEVVADNEKAYDVSCFAVNMDADGNDSVAVGAEEGLSIEWLKPQTLDGQAASIDCEQPQGFVQHKCRVVAKSDVLKLKFEINLKYKKESKKVHDQVMLPYSVSNAFGLVPSLPQIHVQSHEDMRAGGNHKFGRTRVEFSMSELLATKQVYYNSFCLSKNQIFMRLNKEIYKISEQGNAVHFAGIPSEFQASQAKDRYSLNINDYGDFFCTDDGVQILNFKDESYEGGKTFENILIDHKGHIKTETGTYKDLVPVGAMVSPYNFNITAYKASSFKNKKGEIVTLTAEELAADTILAQEDIDFNTLPGWAKAPGGIAYQHVTVKYGTKSFMVLRKTSEGTEDYIRFGAQSFYYGYKPKHIIQKDGYGFALSQLSYYDDHLYIAVNVTKNKTSYLQPNINSFGLYRINTKDEIQVIIDPFPAETLGSKDVSKSILNITGATLTQDNHILFSQPLNTFKIGADNKPSQVYSDLKIHDGKFYRNPKGGFYLLYNADASNSSFTNEGRSLFGFLSADGVLSPLIEGIVGFYAGRYDDPENPELFQSQSILDKVSVLPDGSALVLDQGDPGGIPIVTFGYSCGNVTAQRFLKVKPDLSVEPVLDLIDRESYSFYNCSIQSMTTDSQGNLYYASDRKIHKIPYVEGVYRKDLKEVIYEKTEAVLFENLRWRSDDKLLFSERAYKAARIDGLKFIDLKDTNSVTSIYENAAAENFKCGYGEFSGKANAKTVHKKVEASLASICIGTIKSMDFKDNCQESSGHYTLLLHQAISQHSNMVKVVSPCR